MTVGSQYAVYYTSPTNGHQYGYVFDRIIWDGSAQYSLPASSAVVSDPSGKFPIGSIYTDKTS